MTKNPLTDYKKKRQLVPTNPLSKRSQLPKKDKKRKKPLVELPNWTKQFETEVE